MCPQPVQNQQARNQAGRLLTPEELREIHKTTQSCLNEWVDYMKAHPDLYKGGKISDLKKVEVTGTHEQAATDLIKKFQKAHGFEETGNFGLGVTAGSENHKALKILYTRSYRPEMQSALVPDAKSAFKDVEVKRETKSLVLPAASPTPREQEPGKK